MLHSDNSNCVLIFDELNANASLAVTRHLSGLGYTVDLLVPEGHIATTSKYKRNVYSFRNPSGNASQYRENLMACLQRETYLTVFVFEDHLMEIAFQHLEEINRFTTLFVTPVSKDFDITINKKKSFDFVNQLGIPIPKTYYPRDMADAESIVRKMRYPIILKGEKGTAGIHVKRVYCDSDLHRAYHEIMELEKGQGTSPFIQEMVDGNGYVVHTLFHKGEPVSICIHEKVHEIPVYGGITAIGKTIHSPILEKYAVSILQKLRWEGLAKLDFLYDRKTKEYVFIEIDPRISASIDMCRKAETNMIEKTMDILKGTPVISDLRYRVGLEYAWYFPNELLHLICTRKKLLSNLSKCMRRHYCSDILLQDIGPEIARVKKTLKIIKRNMFNVQFWKGCVHL